jgi:hypothetical protein
MKVVPKHLMLQLKQVCSDGTAFDFTQGGAKLEYFDLDIGCPLSFTFTFSYATGMPGL